MVQKFKMESIHSVVSLHQGYFLGLHRHICMSLSVQGTRVFREDKRIYQFVYQFVYPYPLVRPLPPRVFTKVLALVLALLGKQGNSMVGYMSDLLLWAESCFSVMDNLAITITFYRSSVGF